MGMVKGEQAPDGDRASTAQRYWKCLEAYGFSREKNCDCAINLIIYIIAAPQLRGILFLINHPPNHPLGVMSLHSIERYDQDILINKEMSHDLSHWCYWTHWKRTYSILA